VPVDSPDRVVLGVRDVWNGLANNQVSRIDACALSEMCQLFELQMAVLQIVQLTCIAEISFSFVIR